MVLLGDVRPAAFGAQIARALLDPREGDLVSRAQVGAGRI